ncbi:MAG TPA: hypothetical protein VE223_02965 [Nitrososphaeraceae archaeon]|nr:hypothetical protein [Nitrososphaeraceae archaeon]
MSKAIEVLLSKLDANDSLKLELFDINAALRVNNLNTHTVGRFLIQKSSGQKVKAGLK